MVYHISEPVVKVPINPSEPKMYVIFIIFFYIILNIIYI